MLLALLDILLAQPHHRAQRLDVEAGRLGLGVDIAKAALADLITYTQSPQAIQAYGFVVSQVEYAFALEGQSETAGYQQYPEFSIVPRLPDGVWLQNSQMQIDTSGASIVTLTATGGRTVVRDYIDTTVGEVRSHLTQWFSRQAIVADGIDVIGELRVTLDRADVFNRAGRQIVNDEDLIAALETSVRKM